MGIESEGEEEVVELSDGEVDLLEREGGGAGGEAGGAEEDAGELLPSDDESDSDEEGGALGADGVRTLACGGARGRHARLRVACVRFPP